MYKLSDDIRALLEDVQKFLTSTLASENLNAPAAMHRDELFAKLLKFQQDYPQIITSPGNGNEKLSPSSASPPPYLEMKGQAPPQFPKLEGLSPSADEEYYEEYGSDVMVSTNERSNSMPDSKSLAESEFDEAHGVPEISAIELANAEKTGYLEKKGKERLGGLLNPFQRRWCAIRNGILYYYVNQNDRKQKGHIDLNGYEARPAPIGIKDANKKNCCFEIVCPGKPTFQFIALTIKDMKQWISAVEKQSPDLAILLPKSQVSKVPDPVSEQQKSLERASMRRPIEKTSPVEIPSVAIATVAEDTNNDTDDELYECVGEHKHPAAEEELYEEGESWGGLELEEVYVDADAEESFVPEDWYVGLWDCHGSGELELDFKRGEMIQVIDKAYDKDAWWTGKLGSKVGLVPKAYLMEAYEQE